MASITRIRAVLCFLAVGAMSPVLGFAQGGEDLALEFLIQKVCVDSSGHVQESDPYHCEAGATLRSLKPGEPLPYHRYDQPLANHINDRQRHDSYPVIARDGHVIVINPFDYSPFNQFNQERDGYSITLARDGWTSSGGTRSKLLGTTFFGADCKPFGGWVYFPISDLQGALIKPGEARVPIKGDHWERDGEAWPGKCPSTYNTDTLTSWEPLPAFAFGSATQDSVKTIDAIRSIHGFKDNQKFLLQGHLEALYFTRLYGFTRWETWIPLQRYMKELSWQKKSAEANARCSGEDERIYRNMKFIRVACRDWTVVEVLAQPEAPPPWPVPQLQ